tara:strand:- start:101 stop:403 length:303 start_codon:yes stop_codon:yes gene_type:complete
MNETKRYFTRLHATGFKHTDRFCGFETTAAHFRTAAEVDSEEWNEARQSAIETIGAQSVRNGWTGWKAGKTLVQTHREEVTCMSPAYFEGHRSKPVYEEV